MVKARKPGKRQSGRSAPASHRYHKSLKQKALETPPRSSKVAVEQADPRIQAQLKQYEEALLLFQQQKLPRAKQELERVVAGPSKELADRARMHMRIIEQRLNPVSDHAPRTPEEFYQRGVAMMNLGRWDDAREHLLRAKKLASKADYVYYAMAALDCLTGEAESAMENLKAAIHLRPENRYHARNDEDFAFLQEDPRFTELLYPEREGSGN